MGYTKSEDTQRKLISATSKLLRAKGFAATGINEITQESGVPRGSIYHHFPHGKEELAASAIDAAGQDISARLGRLLKRSGDDVACAVEAFCEDYAQQLERSGYRMGCPLATVTLEAAADVDLIHAATKQAFASMLDIIREGLLRQGLAEPQGSSTAISIICAIEGALLLAKAMRDTSPIHTVKADLGARLRALPRSASA